MDAPDFTTSDTLRWREDPHRTAISLDAKIIIPGRIRIVGLFFCIVGLLGGFLLYKHLVQLALNPALLVCLLPVGLGLLTRRSWSRTAAEACIYGGYAACLMLLLLMLNEPNPFYMTTPGKEFRGGEVRLWFGAGLVVALTGVILSHIVLRSEVADRFFGTR